MTPPIQIENEDQLINVMSLKSQSQRKLMVQVIFGINLMSFMSFYNFKVDSHSAHVSQPVR